MLNNRQYAGELLRDDLVRLCRSNSSLLASGGTVNVSEACPVLERWDLHDDLSSRGAILFRRFVTRFLGGAGLPVSIGLEPTLGIDGFTRNFDPKDPVNTPSGLESSSLMVRRALADAVTDLKNAGIPLDAPLGDHQFSSRGDDKVPIHGGPGGLGVFNAINVSWDPGRGGYPDVEHGSSFIMAMQFRDGSCPVKVGTFVTYGQSENTRSPNFNDYTRAFSGKEWHDFPFCSADVRRATRERFKVVSGAGRKGQLRVAASPSRPRAGRRTRFRFRVTALREGKRVGIRGARITFAGRRVKTDRSGRAGLTRRVTRAGRVTARACQRPYDCGTARVRVRRR